MRILIFHGYLLRGTGSNIYNANLVQALARQGHEVHLFCQDLDAAELDWVDATGDWSEGELVVEARRETGAPGSVTVYRPPIGKILPVYVEDPYSGFEARAFPRLEDDEIEHYISVNVEAVREVIDLVGVPDAALANHLIMGPVILARAEVPDYAVKNHGSDLEYTVKPHPRFIPYVVEGLRAASAVLVGSWHTAKSLWEAIPELELESITGLGPPGVQPDDFKPIPAADAPGQLLELAARLEAAGNGEGALGRDPRAAASAVRTFASSEGPRIVFVGKLIVSKGVDLLVAAWPLIHARNPGASLLLAGFGEFRVGLESLVEALGSGDLEAARAIASRGRGLEGGSDERLEFLSSFLQDPPGDYLSAAREAAGSIVFTGRLEHGEVAGLLPACDAMVVPSTFPEAFGMVAAEAASAGILPVCADHSGLAEVAGVLADEVPAIASLVSFELGPGSVSGIADRVNGWLTLDQAARAVIGGDVSASAERNWSWAGVARDVIAGARGEVRPLTPP
jgi:glycosyltransferase involved in cell wall biosynthesis